jgi:hypothetical protein
MSGDPRLPRVLVESHSGDVDRLLADRRLAATA